MPAKCLRSARPGPDAHGVFSEGNYRTAAKQQDQAHAVQAGVRGDRMYPEEIAGVPSKRMSLGGPVRQKHQGVFLEGLPSDLWPVRMSRHGKKIGNALDPCFRDTIRHLQENGVATWWANG